MNLDNLRGWMKNEDCVVAGCGPTAGTFDGHYQVRWTLGCNRAASFCSPDFGVCVEPKREKVSWGHVIEANPLIIFTHVDAPAHPRCIQISSKNIDEWFIEGFDTMQQADGYKALRIGQSPFYAAACALWLGFETIGLIGVDLTPDRYGDRDVNTSNEMYGRLNALANSKGSKLINLNPDSRLTSIPQGQWADVRTK